MTTTSGALSHIKKAFDYVEHLSESNRCLYSSTKRTIKEMMQICEDIIEIGNSLVDGTRCPCRESKHDENKRCNDDSLSNSLEQRLSRIEHMLDNMIKSESSKFKENSSKSSDKFTNKETSKSVEKSESTTRNKQSISNCSAVIDTLNQNIHDNPEAFTEDQLAVGDVICRWYKTRFMDLDKTKSKFRYHIKNIPLYIQSIVADYANSKDKSAWRSDFNSWLDRIKSNDETVSSYALPYNTFETYKEIKDANVSNPTRCINDSAADIWEGLVRNGMSGLMSIGAPIQDCMSDSMRNKMVQN